MKIIITESQHKKILLESASENAMNKLDSLRSFFTDVLKTVKKQFGIDIEFLLTWGTTIGGFVQPVSEFIKGEFPDITITNLALISTGVIITYFTSNKKLLGEVVEKIKENGMIYEFDQMLRKAGELKKVFLAFVSSLALPMAKIANMLAYSFLIPIIPELYEFAQGHSDIDVVDTVKRIVSYLGLTSLGFSVKKLITSIVERFKS
jgi:hypothetical protein